MTLRNLSRCRTQFNGLEALGPFFAVETHLRGESRPPPWEPMANLVQDHRRLATRVDAVRTALADRAGNAPVDIDVRVAASVAHLGLIARLLAPAIGMIALDHTPASLSLDDLWWQNELDGPYPLSITQRSTTEPPGAGLAVEAFSEAFAECSGISHRVLWGNVGSAANSAAKLISAARTDLTGPAHAAADAVLADPRIDGGALCAGPLFQRRSCCLIYRLAQHPAVVCGDCILR